MPSEDTEEARRQRSDDARRAALRERIERQKERERQIAADIANVDKKPTKRIVFADSDDEEEESDKGDNKTASKSSSKRPKLFDSEDEKDDEGDDVNVINEIVNRHSGAKGEKLMKLESRFNADPRFKLDDKFAESDSDEDGDPVLNAEKSEMKQEKDKNRELLSKILGKSVEEKKPKQTSSDASGALLKARPFTRFDPENPEHLEWMKAFEAAKNPKSKVKSAENEDDKEDDKETDKEDDKEEEPEKSEDEEFDKAEMFFKMDDQFAEEMKERKEAGPESNGGFSFLSMIGRKYEEKDEGESDEEAEVEKEALKHVEKEEKTVKSTGLGPLLKTKPPTSGPFFVDPFKDEKIKSMAANFRRTQTVEKIIDKWAPHRDAIFKLWKKQRRDAVKKQKDAFFTNGGRQRKRKIEENGNKKEEN